MQLNSGNDNDNNQSGSGNEKNMGQNDQKYRRSKILAHFIEEQFIGEHHIILMRFIELKDGEDEEEYVEESN